MVIKLEKYKEIEKSIMTDYLKTIWDKFIKAVRDYKLISNGDKIAVGLSGGKDSITLLMSLKALQRFYSKKFEIIAVSVNPGSNHYV